MRFGQQCRLRAANLSSGEITLTLCESHPHSSASRDQEVPRPAVVVGKMRMEPLVSESSD